MALLINVNKIRNNVYIGNTIELMYKVNKINLIAKQPVN